MRIIWLKIYLNRNLWAIGEERTLSDDRRWQVNEREWASTVKKVHAYSVDVAVWVWRGDVLFLLLFPSPILDVAFSKQLRSCFYKQNPKMKFESIYNCDVGEKVTWKSPIRGEKSLDLHSPQAGSELSPYFF